ncbi:peptidoglycan editing factor PgeF [Mucisphaera calidilacus]|uniref:Purine nucleoside phosphorylase n=1 Tax=Mucisphaera calidilacus TaxID=2527982 RepID=A0A518C188_9BACT|nr:peptidoglycan editing factor PgeF [Mucisphaera calidilacus]QDU72980.1 Laccase domain protein YfiH [Mucisphaera calidilacus]
MLERVEHHNGVVTYQSPILRQTGAPHAFTTRIGGASKGDYTSLNLAIPRKGGNDPNTNIAWNFRLLRQALDLKRAIRLEAIQDHADNVYLDPSPQPLHPDQRPHADAIITRYPGKMITIRTADCVPILIAAPDARVVAGIHAGWRGFVAGSQGIIHAAIQQLTAQHDLNPAQLRAAIGPAISATHYEVGEEVAQAFTQGGHQHHVRRDLGSKPHLDLPAAAHDDLTAAGLQPQFIDTTDRCTFANPDEFYSYRRDQGRNGQMAAIILTPRDA